MKTNIYKKNAMWIIFAILLLIFLLMQFMFELPLWQKIITAFGTIIGIFIVIYSFICDVKKDKRANKTDKKIEEEEWKNIMGG